MEKCCDVCGEKHGTYFRVGEHDVCMGCGGRAMRMVWEMASDCPVCGGPIYSRHNLGQPGELPEVRRTCTPQCEHSWEPGGGSRVSVDRAALASLLDRCETRWGPSAPMPSDGDPGAPGGACCSVCEGHREGDRDAVIPHDQECVVPGLRAALLAGRG